MRCRTLRLYGFLWALAASPVLADDCVAPMQLAGRVASVIDGRTLRLDDQSEIRLAGLAPLPPDHETRARAALERLILGQDVTLHADSDAPDRYGRQSMLVRLADGGPSVQVALLAQGDALADTTLQGCSTLFRAAEATARGDRLGVWADAAVIKNTESAGDILAEAGQFVVVEGRVLSVRQAGSVTYVNFGRRWTRDFAVTMPARALPVFAAAGLAPQTFEGKTLRVRGMIERHGGPRIEATRASQIEIVGPDRVTGASER